MRVSNPFSQKGIEPFKLNLFEILFYSETNRVLIAINAPGLSRASTVHTEHSYNDRISNSLSFKRPKVMNLLNLYV